VGIRQRLNRDGDRKAKAIATRIRRLEAKFVPQEDLASWRTANILYERLRRCSQAAGEPFEDPPPAPAAGGPLLVTLENNQLFTKLGNQQLIANRSGIDDNVLSDLNNITMKYAVGDC